MLKELDITQICQRVLGVSIYHKKQRMLIYSGSLWFFTLVKMQQHVDD